MSFAVLSFITSHHTPAPSTTTRLTIPSHTRLLQILSRLRRDYRGTVRGHLSTTSNHLVVTRRRLSCSVAHQGLANKRTRLTIGRRGLGTTTRDHVRRQRTQLHRTTTLTSSLDPCQMLKHNCTVMCSDGNELYDTSTLTTNSGLALHNTTRATRYAIVSIRRLGRDARGL